MDTARALLTALAALSLSACSALFGPTVDLPADVDEAVAKPAIGSRALLRANRVELELASWQPAVQAAIGSLGERIEPAQADALRAATRRAYAAQRLYDRMATSLAADWDPAAARALFDFYATRLGRRVLAGQALRSDPKALERFQRANASFDAGDYRAARLDTLRRIDRALVTSQSAVFVNRAVLDGALGAFAQGLAPGPAEAFAALRQRYADEEPALYPLAAEQVLRWNLYALASVSDADLERYAVFAESEPAQWYLVASTRAFRVTASGAGDELFQALRPRGAY